MLWCILAPRCYSLDVDAGDDNDEDDDNEEDWDDTGTIFVMNKLRLFGQKRLKLDVDGRIIGLINSKLTFIQSSRLSLKSSWHPHPYSLDQRGWMAAKPGCVQLCQGRQLHRADHVPGASRPVSFDSWALSDQDAPRHGICPKFYTAGFSG